jgi:hypothetical protein
MRKLKLQVQFNAYASSQGIGMVDLGYDAAEHLATATATHAVIKKMA